MPRTKSLAELSDDLLEIKSDIKEIKLTHQNFVEEMVKKDDISEIKTALKEIKKTEDEFFKTLVNHDDRIISNEHWIDGADKKIWGLALVFVGAVLAFFFGSKI